MEIKNLEIILALDSEKHFNRAAEKLNISQPALSMKLKSLENEIGVKLVKRGKNYMGLTTEGQILKERFKNIVKEYSNIKQLSSELRNNLTGNLRIGVIPTALLDVSFILNSFVKKFKNVKLQVFSMSSNEIDKNLHDFKLDLGISYLDNEPILGVEKIPLYEETYYLISKKDELKNLKNINWEECGDLDLCLISKENQFRRILDAVFKENSINPRVLIESNSLTHIYSHVNSSNFSTIMPYIFTQSFNYDKGTSFIKLVSPEISNKVGIVHIGDKGPSPIKNNFLKFLKNIDK
tara:strand:- start:2173 stop:3054 length:882 start_codon:yes stop_codon:yes gene_type:complete